MVTFRSIAEIAADIAAGKNIHEEQLKYDVLVLLQAISGGSSSSSDGSSVKVTPLISDTSGSFPLSDAAQFSAYYESPDGYTGTINGKTVPHGFTYASPVNRHILAGSFTLVSSGTGKWITAETP